MPGMLVCVDTGGTPMSRSVVVLSIFLALILSAAAADQYDIVINELMYNPASDDPDDEFLELFNRGATPVDLSGWEFTDGFDFVFPGGVVLGAGEYLVVARNADQVKAHYGVTNVIGNYDGKLANEGETVELSNASHQVIDVVTYDDEPPWPIGPDGLGQSLELVNPWADNDTPRNWRCGQQAGWRYIQRTGTATSSLLYIYLLNAGECLVDDVSIVPAGGGDEHIVNGGFESGLSPWEVLGNHANSYITTQDSHSGTHCMHIVSTGIGGSVGNSLHAYTSPNLVEGNDYTLSFWARYLSGETALYSRLSYGGIGGQSILTGEGTPGAPNTRLSLDVPPYIRDVKHLPDKPNSSSYVVIRARVDDDSAVTQVMLHYNDGSGWTTAQMYDDGAHSDGAAGDGVYGCRLTPRPSQTLVRYKVEAVDDAGQHEYNPYPSDPIPNWGYFPYNNEVTTQLPLYWIYADPADLASLDDDIWSDETIPITFVVDQKVYDGSQMRYRGQTARYWPKKCYKVIFPKGNRYLGYKRINLNACYPDKSFLRERLSWGLFRDAGNAYCECYDVRVQMNNAFFGLFAFVEQPNDDWLERNGRDPDGNLYKAYAQLELLGSDEDYWYYYEKKTNEAEGNEDLVNFVKGLNQTPDDQIGQWLLDHVDIDSLILYQAANMLVHNNDQPAKNYYMYHDPSTDKWEAFVWDLDLTLGRNFELSGGVCNDTYRYDSHPYFGTRDFPKNDGPWNRLIDAFLRRTSVFQKAYLTRLHELTDTLLTPDYFYPKIDQWIEEIRPEVALDRAKWGSYGATATWDLDYQKDILKRYVTDRYNLLKRKWLLINPGWNWISFPKIPDNPDPASIFGYNDVRNRLYRWHPTKRTFELYPDDFTGVEVGRAYVLWVSEGTYNTHYYGTEVPSSIFEIPVPEAGWVWVGHPRTRDVRLDRLYVRDNDTGVTRTATADQGAADPWMNWNWLYWNSYGDNPQLLSFSGGDDNTLHPWFGYCAWAYKRNLTLRIPNS
jgi:hypothetical protein